MKYFLIILLLICTGCAWSHSTGSTTASRRCSVFIEWDDCARAVSCTHARAWYTATGSYKETWVCIEKSKSGLAE